MSHQKVDLVQKIFTVDSKDRTSGSSSSFYVNLDMPRFNAFNKASVLYVDVPKSYYSSDTALTGLIDGSDAFTLATNKFWTASSFTTDLETALNASASAVTFTVTYNLNSDGKLIITGDAGFTIETGSALLAKYMGLVENVTYTHTANVVTSVNIVNMQRYERLFINCSIVSNNNTPQFLTLFPSGTPDLASIGYSTPAVELGSVNLTNNGATSAHFSLVDENGAVVVLNGVNMRLVFTAYNDSD